MPYTEKQHRLFAAAAHDAKIAKKHGLSKGQASRLMKEGMKKERKHSAAKTLSRKGE